LVENHAGAGPAARPEPMTHITKSATERANLDELA